MDIRYSICNVHEFPNVPYNGRDISHQGGKEKNQSVLTSVNQPFAEVSNKTNIKAIVDSACR